MAKEPERSPAAQIKIEARIAKAADLTTRMASLDAEYAKVADERRAVFAWLLERKVQVRRIARACGVSDNAVRFSMQVDKSQKKA